MRGASSDWLASEGGAIDKPDGGDTMMGCRDDDAAAGLWIPEHRAVTALRVAIFYIATDNVMGAG